MSEPFLVALSCGMLILQKVTFSDGYAVRVQIVKHVVSNHQVCNSLGIDTVSKVLVVVAREAKSDTVVSVHHARHSVESETIKSVLLNEEPKVAQQEPHYLVAAIVEQTRVPQLMATFGALVEVLVVASVKLVETIKNVLAGV